MNDVMPRKRRGPDATLWEKFLDRVDASGDCWQWTGHSHRGYGIMPISHGCNAMAHRAVWELLVGLIPDGLTIDHRCYNTLCVNPDHLEPVTLSENVRRRRVEKTLTFRYATRAQCSAGHPYDETNTYYRSNGTHRRCKECDKTYRPPKGVPRKPSPNICTEDGCGKPINARGLCPTHYKRLMTALARAEPTP